MPDDSTDEPTRADLEDRIEQLEATVSRMLPSRRDVLKTGAGVGLGAAGVYAASGGASGQSGPAGQVGTDDRPADVKAWDVDIQNELNGGGPLSEGDGTERQVWVIANGASDPAGADPEDIIFEEES